MINFKGRHFEQEMIPQSVRWYLTYSLSYRDIEEMMKERGFEVDHSTIQGSVANIPRPDDNGSYLVCEVTVTGKTL